MKTYTIELITKAVMTLPVESGQVYLPLRFLLIIHVKS